MSEHFVKVRLQVPERVLDAVMKQAFHTYFGRAWNWQTAWDGNWLAMSPEGAWLRVVGTDDGVRSVRTDWETVARGMQKILDRSTDKELRARVENAILNDDPSEISYLDADQIVQYGLYGEASR